MYARSEHLHTTSGWLRIKYEQPSWAYGERWYWVFVGGHSIGGVEKIKGSRKWTINEDHNGRPHAEEFATRRDAVLSLLKIAGHND